MIDGGVSEIGESRLENIHRLRAGGILAPIVLLRIPPLSGAEEIVGSVDLSLNSEVSVLQSLSHAAESIGTRHDVVLMVDLGDLREGFWPDDLIPAAREVRDLPGVRVVGIGTNLSCYGGVVPTRRNMQALVEHARRVEDVLGTRLEIVSGGNSSSLPLLAAGEMPAEINHLRIGEALLLGRETIERSAWPGTVQDAFVLSAEVIELKRKPSVPIGETAQDAFGAKPSFVDMGERLRAILNIGREDVDVSGLAPLEPEVSIIGASSDHLILDLGAGEHRVRLGDELQFLPNYSALLAGMTSAYVEKRLRDRSRVESSTRRLAVFGAAKIFDRIERWEGLRALGYTAEVCDPALLEQPERVAPLLQQGGLPVFAGRESLSVRGYRAVAQYLAREEHGPLGVLWLAPRANLPPELWASELGRDATERDTIGHHTAAEYRCVSAENLVFACLQDATPTEQELIRRLRVEAYTMEDVDLSGVREVIRRSLRRAAFGTRGLYVRFDPACADNGRDGLTNREVHLALELVALSGLLRALDISGYAPTGGREVKRVRHFVLSALGKRILAR